MVDRILSILAGLALLFGSAGVSAQGEGLDRFKSFVNGVQTLRGSFEQTVLDRDGKVTQKASGTLQFSRPGKFRWEYLKPYKQLVVGDGQKLWIHDPDLNQVTVRNLDQAIGSSPAALLAGDQEIEKNFNLKDTGTKDGLSWLEATPKSRETSFERVRMGFNTTTLQVMELKDNFGQTTVIQFSQLERNPKLAADSFRFAPPKGADVIRE